MTKTINGITEVTNGHYRELFDMVVNDDYELVEFDNRTMNEEIESVPCFTYKGNIYSLNEVMRASDECSHDGYMGFTYFNGLYIDFNESNESVKVTYFHQ